MDPDHGAYHATEFRCEDYERRERQSWGIPINDVMICGQLPPSPEKRFNDLFNYYTGMDCDPFWKSDKEVFDFEPAEELWMNHGGINWSNEDQLSFDNYYSYVERVIQDVVETAVAEAPKARKRGRPRTKHLQSVNPSRMEKGLETPKPYEEKTCFNNENMMMSNMKNPGRGYLEPLAKKIVKPPLKFSLVAGLSMINASKPLPSREVYRFVKHYFPDVVQGKYWKNSIRHAMCTSDLISKVPLQTPGTNSGNEWTVSPEKRGQFLEAIRAFEISYSDPAIYGMSDPSLWKSICQGKEGLPAPDIFVDLEEPKRASRPKPGYLESGQLQQRDPNVRPEKRPRQPSQVRFLTKRAAHGPLQVDANLEALIDQLPLSPISMDSCDLFYESPLSCPSPQKMDFSQMKGRPDSQLPTTFPFFSFE